MLKKTITYTAIALIIISVSFFAGRTSTADRITDLERQAANIASQLETEAERNRERTAELEKAKSQIGKLQNRVDSLTESNRLFADKLSGIGSGLSDDIRTVSDIAERIDYYIKQSQITKNSNNP